MKKFLSANLLIAFLTLTFVAVSCSDDDNDDEVNVPVEALPEVGKTFVSTHFPDATISKLQKNKGIDEDGTLFEAYLSNGFELDFAPDGTWTGVDGHLTAVPQSVIDLLPEALTTYINTNYSGQTIVEVEKKSYGLKVELLNDLDLMFKSDGTFIGIDR